MEHEQKKGGLFRGRLRDWVQLGGWGFSSELGFEHELYDSAGGRRALEVSVRAAWRRHGSGDLAERTRREVSVGIGKIRVI